MFNTRFPLSQGQSCIMFPFLLQDFCQVDFSAADVQISHELTGLTSLECSKYWFHFWEYYRPTNSNTYIQKTLFEKIIPIVTSFAERVRTGYCDQNNQVTVQSVQGALCTIVQTCGSDREKNCTQIVPDGYLKHIDHHLLCMIN